MPREHRIGNSLMILGDSKELSAAYAHSADLVMSDPPYRLTAGGKPKNNDGFSRMGGIFGGDVYDNSGLLMSVPSWEDVCEVYSELAKPNCDGYMMTNDKNLRDALNAAQSAGWKLHNVLTWDKVTATPNRFYMKNLEFVLYLWRGKARGINNKGSKQSFERGFRKDERAQKFHPTQKPIGLMRHYIENSSSPGDVVIDPYCGSGSSVIAAEACGRIGVGFEISEANFEKAVANAQRSLDEHKRSMDV